MKRKNAVSDTIAIIKKECAGIEIKTGKEIHSINNDVISTGIEKLDNALCVGGLLKGSIVEIFGNPNAGKTTLALHISKQFQKMKKPVLYIDTERTLTSETIAWEGVNTDDDFYVVRTNILEEAFAICKLAAETFGLIVIDSLPGLVRRAEMEDNIQDYYHEEPTEKDLSRFYPKILSELAKNECILVIINQIRTRYHVMFGVPECTLGGKALEFYATTRLDVRRADVLKDKWHTVTYGTEVNITVRKNKISPSYHNDNAVKVNILNDGGLVELN